MFDFGAQKSEGEKEFAEVRRNIAQLRAEITGPLANQQDPELRVRSLQDVVNKSLNTIEKFEAISGFNAAKLLLANGGLLTDPDISTREIRETLDYYKNTEDLRSKLVNRKDPIKDMTTIIGTIEAIAKYDSPFGIKTGAPSARYFTSSGESKVNICGPMAAFDILSQKSDHVANLSEAKKTELAESLYAEARTGAMGTFPSNLTMALENIGSRWGLDPTKYSFPTAQEAVSFVKNKAQAHEPVLIKIGNQLLSQHYTTIVGLSGTTTNQEHGYALGADGLKIPLNELARLMSQGPDAFSAWTVNQNSLASLHVPKQDNPFSH